MKQKVVIIGGGLGGLFAGAMLAKEGLQVTVLEKNQHIGGGLQSFTRFDETFDTGMHIIGGMQKGGTAYRICRYLGIVDRVSLKATSEECSDLLYFAEDHTTYRIARGREGFINSLAQYFPHEREHLEQYVEAVYRLTGEVELFNLRPAGSNLNMFACSEEFALSAEAFIARYIEDKKLRAVLAYMNPLYGGRANQTPAYVHVIVSSLYIDGGSRFVDGSEQFANVLRELIEEHDGQVIAGDGVCHVDITDRRVNYVQTRSGKQYEADYYISAIHPCSLLKLTDEKAFPKAYRERLEQIPNAYSAFTIFIKLKAGSFPYINHSEFYMTRYDDIWNFGEKEKAWPLGFLFMTPPQSDHPDYSTRAIVMAPMRYDMASKWEDTYIGRRGDDYEEWKREHAERLLAMVEEMHPGFRDCIEQINTASPLTIRDWYGVKEGSISGFSKDYKNLAQSQVPVVTKVKNLLLTGQNNNLHGFCGVPLTAINTCEAILGVNYIINKINQCDAE